MAYLSNMKIGLILHNAVLTSEINQAFLWHTHMATVTSTPLLCWYQCITYVVVDLCCSHIFFWGGLTSVPFMSINSCRLTCHPLAHTRSHRKAVLHRLETNSSRFAPFTYAYLNFLATVIFTLPLFHQLINSNDVPNCRHRHQLQPHHHFKPNGYLTYQMTHWKVLCAQQVCVSVREHIRWLHACDAERGRAASSINSSLSSSAVVQTWINGAINLSFQMYYFSTSILFPAGYWCPPPEICAPRLLSSLTRTSRWIVCHFINPWFGILWHTEIPQSSNNSSPPHHRDERRSVIIECHKVLHYVEICYILHSMLVLSNTQVFV